MRAYVSNCNLIESHLNSYLCDCSFVRQTIVTFTKLIKSRISTIKNGSKMYKLHFLINFSTTFSFKYLQSSERYHGNYYK